MHLQLLNQVFVIIQPCLFQLILDYEEFGNVLVGDKVNLTQEPIFADARAAVGKHKDHKVIVFIVSSLQKFSPEAFHHRSQPSVQDKPHSAQRRAGRQSDIGFPKPASAHANQNACLFNDMVNESVAAETASNAQTMNKVLNFESPHML